MWSILDFVSQLRTPHPKILDPSLDLDLPSPRPSPTPVCMFALEHCVRWIVPYKVKQSHWGSKMETLAIAYYILVISNKYSGANYPYLKVTTIKTPTITSHLTENLEQIFTHVSLKYLDSSTFIGSLMTGAGRLWLKDISTSSKLSTFINKT